MGSQTEVYVLAHMTGLSIFSFNTQARMYVYILPGVSRGPDTSQNWKRLLTRNKMAAFYHVFEYILWRMRISAAIKMADYALAVQCCNHSSFATERFQIKPLEISDLHFPLGKSYRL